MYKSCVNVAAISCLLFVMPANAADVDIVATYDSGAESYIKNAGSSITATIMNNVAQINRIYAKQNIPITLVLKKILKQDFATKEINNTLLAQVRSGDGALKNAYRADYAIHFSKSSTSYCGIAGVRKDEKSTGQYNTYFSASAIDCDYLTVAHELGHNFGLNHSKKQDGTGAVYPYGLGYAVEGKFATIMVHNYIYSQFGGGAILDYFSDPEYYHPTYGYIGDASSNAKLALKNITPYISKGDECIAYGGGCQYGSYGVSSNYLDQDYNSMSNGNSQKTVLLSLSDSGNGLYTGVINKDTTVPFTTRNISISMYASLYSLSSTYGPPTVNLRSCALSATPDKAYKVTFDTRSDNCTLAPI